MVRLRLAEPLAVDTYARNRDDRRLHPHRRGDERNGRRPAWCSRRLSAAPHGRPVPRPRRDRLARAALQPGVDRRSSRVPRHRRPAGGGCSRCSRCSSRSGSRFGRRFCLPCLAYFELIQPRFGEGPLEDSRPPRIANMVGYAVLTAASVALRGRLRTCSAPGSALVVAALALLAAITGFCTGCEAYKLGCRLTRPAVRLVPAAARGRDVTWQFTLAGAAGRRPRRHDRHGRRQPDDADPDPAVRLRRQGRGRHRHPPRRDLQVVRRRPAPDARDGARPARVLDARRLDAALARRRRALEPSATAAWRSCSGSSAAP